MSSFDDFGGVAEAAARDEVITGRIVVRSLTPTQTPMLAATQNVPTSSVPTAPRLYAPAVQPAPVATPSQPGPGPVPASSNSRRRTGRSRRGATATINPPAPSADRGSTYRSAPPQPSPTASPEELKVLREYVELLDSQYKAVKAKYEAGAAGGSAATFAQAAYGLAVAQGELALAEGNREAAVRRFEEARSNAEQAVEAVTAVYESGQITYDVLLGVTKKLSEIKRRLIRLQQEQKTSADAADRYGSAATIGTTMQSRRTPGGVVYEQRSPDSSQSPVLYSTSAVPPAEKESRLTQIFTLKYADAAQMERTVQTIIDDVRLSIDRRTKSLIVSGTAKTVEKVAELVKVLDRPAQSEPTFERPAAQSIQMLELELKAAQVKYRQAREKLERGKKLADRNVLSTPEFSEMQAEHDLAELEVQAAELRLEEAQERHKRQDADQSSMLYHGRTFDEWRNQWRTELSHGQRAEAVLALAAFGAAGKAEEAAAEIFDVARQYDWSRRDNQVQGACLAVLSGRTIRNGSIDVSPAHVIPTEVWFPMVVEGIRDGDTAISKMAVRLFRYMNSNQKLALPALLELRASAEGELLDAIHAALFRIDGSDHDPRVEAIWRDLLGSDDPELVVSTIEMLGRRAFGVIGDPSTILLHANPIVQQAARRVLDADADEALTNQTIEWALAILNDPSRKSDHLPAIRSLAALGGRLRRLEDDQSVALERLMAIAGDDAQPEEIRVAATIALWQVSPRSVGQSPDPGSRQREMAAVLGDGGRRSRGGGGFSGGGFPMNLSFDRFREQFLDQQRGNGRAQETQ